MALLDGKDKIKPTPFDSHEQVVRQPHTHSLKHGYQPLAADETLAPDAPAADRALDPSARDETAAEEKTREKAELDEEHAEDVQPRKPRKTT